MPDVSLILALHREGHYLTPTLRSLAEAVIYARRCGIGTELVAVLDRSDPATEAALFRFDLSCFEQHKILHTNHGSLGLTRNAGCQAAQGTFVLTADGDDLISFNTIERMFRAAEQLGPRAILIPNFIFAFGADYHVAEFFGLDQVTPLALLRDNPFVSRIFFHRSLCQQLSYQDVSLTNGYAFEDWHFNCQAVALGYTFHAVADTILFYRQRPDSLLQRGWHISVRQIPPSALFQPETFSRRCGPWIERLSAGGDSRPAVTRRGRTGLRDPLCLELLAAAHQIEPAIALHRLLAAPCFDYLEVDLKPAFAFHKVCQTLGDCHFNEIFLLPFLTAGGADRYVLDIIDELTARDPDTRVLIVFGEQFERYAWLERLPPSCVTIDLFAVCPELAADGHDLVCLKLIQVSGPRTRLHLRSSYFAQRFFERFAPVLAEYRPVFYRFSDGRNTYGDLTLTEPSAFSFVAEHIDYLDQIVCDSEGIRSDDQRRLGFMPEKWQVLHAKMGVPQPPSTTVEAPRSRSILWVSRLDPEKRPRLLMEIARLLGHSMPDISVDVFGRPTLDEFDLASLTSVPTIRYHGAFAHFADLDVASHDCFVYTSRYDGIPIVLLEMMAAGIPIIAPNVGYIGEIIRDNETGVLLECSGDDAADARCYAAAIEMLLADSDLRARLARQALVLLREKHAPHRFAQTVAEIFGLPTSVSPAMAAP